MNISMKVPDVVQMTRKMMTNIATDGPESQSHRLRPRISPCAQPGLSTPTALKARWSSPRLSLNHCGPSMPKKPRKALTAPELEKRKRKTVAMAMELVTDGK